MNPNTFHYILNKSITLPVNEMKVLVKELLQQIINNDHQNITDEYVANISCPYCNSKVKVKNGKLKNRQRYLCKSCRKSYNVFTKTPISYSKKDIQHWEKYIQLLLSCESLRKTAKILNISLSTAFYWRHKLLDALREHSTVNFTLKNSVKILEHYTRESYKGQQVPPTRSSYKSGQKREYRFIDDRYVCTLIAFDGANPPLIEMSCLDKPKDDTLEAIFDTIIEPGSAIITDKWIPYKRLAHKKNLIYVPYLNRYHKSRKYHAGNVDSISIQLNYFLNHFNGVSTKYLENYLSLFKRIYYFTCKLDFDLQLSSPIRVRDYKFRKPVYR